MDKEHITIAGCEVPTHAHPNAYQRGLLRGAREVAIRDRWLLRDILWRNQQVEREGQYSPELKEVLEYHAALFGRTVEEFVEEIMK